jgi:hypothetical protein
MGRVVEVMLTPLLLVRFWAGLFLDGFRWVQEIHIANDSYLPTMRKDPVYLWKPSVKFKRSEGVNWSANQLAGNSHSTFTISWTFQDREAVPALLEELQEIAREAGYVDDRRELMRLNTLDPTIAYVNCFIFSVPDDAKVIARLRAPS